MSTRDTPEISSAYGSIDSAAFHDGQAVDAHLERVVTMNANRLQAKGQHIYTLNWQDNPIDDEINFRWIPSTSWTRVSDPIPIQYPPGLSKADVRIHARILGSETIWMQIATKAQPFSRSATTSDTNTLALTGDGDDDIDPYGKDDIWIDPSGYDELDIRLTGIATTVAGDSGVGGPNTRTGYGGSFTYAENWIGHAGAGSFIAGGYSLAGSEIVFDDGGGFNVRRLVTSVPGTNLLYFAPVLDSATLTAVQAADDWEIYRLPTIGLVSISLAAVERTV